uniref:Uncharacterized protein n=1 Tax=Rhizophora mucronata TaxID=61149 RepID=A0A2P2QT54_RHIMU
MIMSEQVSFLPVFHFLLCFKLCIVPINGIQIKLIHIAK